MKLTNFNLLCITLILFGLCVIQSSGRVQVEADLRERIKILEYNDIEIKKSIKEKILDRIMSSCFIGESTKRLPLANHQK